MRAILVLSSFCILLCGYIHAGPICMHCNGAVHIADCFLNTVSCGDLEDCYLDKYLDEHSAIRYDAGCRSKQVCSSQGRRRRRLLICTSCCSDAPDYNGPCNSKLCGVGAVSFANSTCVSCDGVHSDVASCSSSAICNPNEVCYTGIRIVGSSIRYVFGCYEERICLAMMENDNKNSTIHRPGRVIYGDRGTTICDGCCKGYRCNAEDCFIIKKRNYSSFVFVSFNRMPRFLLNLHRTVERMFEQDLPCLHGIMNKFLLLLIPWDM